MTRFLRQQFKGIYSTEKCPLFYVKYVSHDKSPSNGLVNGCQVDVYVTTVGIVFCGEDDAKELIRYFKNGDSFRATEYRIKLSFQDPMEFKKFADSRESQTLALWNGIP